MADIKISQLGTASPLDGAEIVPVVQMGATVKTTVQDIADLAGGYVEIAGTLAAGSTSITLSNAAITSTSTIDIYTDVFGVNPTACTVATGSVSLTFAESANNLSVKVRVS